MDSKEILEQHMMGAMEASAALSQLRMYLHDLSTPVKAVESSKAGCAIGLILRRMQYDEGRASSRDVCLSVREAVHIFGRIKVDKRIYQVVTEHGQEFGLVHESNLQVSGHLFVPDWLHPDTYIKDVYAFRRSDSGYHGGMSIGNGILQENTKFQAYKSYEQKLAVHTALDLPRGHTLLVSLPTGAGKSLVTQMLSCADGSLTIVIVPTVSLALDQYHAAKSNLRRTEGLYCYRGEQTQQERAVIMNALRDKSARLLFISPEAIIRNIELGGLLLRLAEERYITNVIIDEAHIVPDWGALFRPDFQLFSVALKNWKKVSGGFIRTFLLSATLSDDVVESLFMLFGSAEGNIQYRCDTLRQEPRFYFYSARSKDEQMDKVTEAVMYLPKPMIVYVLEPEKARSVQKHLRKEGFRNIPVFTGETHEAERDKILIGWKDHEYDVVVATSAFGIGVDKADVRTVVHACCPESLSRYYQEVGRGGRDGNPSISLLLPYQSQYDMDSDIRQAHGLVNKSVLTVERAVVRWKSLLSAPTTWIDGDICELDMSATPETMTDDEAEHAGNRNIAWNVNLLLMLYRIGLVEPLDVRYDPTRGTYEIKVKLLKPETLQDREVLSAYLMQPREKEYKARMNGYYIVRDLISAPEKTCWGRIFKKLYPLSEDVCNGCPVDPEGRLGSDGTYKLREDPALSLLPDPPSELLSRNMGTYTELIVSRSKKGPFTSGEIQTVADAAERCGIGVMVLPGQVVGQVGLQGLILDYGEFLFTARHAPYIFHRGVLCVFGDDAEINAALWKSMRGLEGYGYRRMLYCAGHTIITENRKTARECVEGYTVPLERL